MGFFIVIFTISLPSEFSTSDLFKCHYTNLMCLEIFVILTAVLLKVKTFWKVVH